MNIVLYTQDFEPITVIDLPLWLLEKVDSDGYVKVAVPNAWTLKILQKVLLMAAHCKNYMTLLL